MADHATTVVELVHAARRGDTTAFGELVDRFRDMVYGLAYHLTGDFEDAVDLAQDAFVRAYERLPQLRDATRFPGWLRQIVTNLHRTSARRSRPSVEPPRQHDSAPGEIQLAVREALQGLREPDRLVLTLHYINGYSQAEIGDFLDTSADVVKTRLARARARLRSGVTEMMEDTLSQQRLPSSFRGGVVAGVAALVRDLRKVVPSDLDDVVERLGLRRNAMWREVMATRPDADQPLVPQSDAQARPLSGYPDDAQQTALQAIEITALQHTLACLSPPSWVADLDCLWVWLKPDTVEGRTSAWLSRVPGKTWRVCMFQFDRPAPAPTGPPSRHARHRDVGQLLRSLAD
ncbi:MAG TPA: sigma-70 family RNA polymerase sigma factor, partial [Armatimonadota bacterium]|nr:sigma-70 family RNA polymerase sigma factor [Armatimonadota bacterium]